MRRALHATVVTLALALGSRAAARCVQDAEQALYDGGTSARTLPGYDIWQSFTPSRTGTLCGIDMGFFNDMSGRARLDVLEGEGTSGAVLSSQVVTIVGFSVPGPTWNEWDVSVPVSGGALHTFRITPDAATLPDPYGVCVGSGDPYPAGSMGLDDPSGSYFMPFDVVFRTHLQDGASGPSVFRDDAPQDVVDAAHEIASGAASPFDDPAPPPEPLLFYVVDGVPPAVRATRLGPGGVRLTWP